MAYEVFAHNATTTVSSGGTDAPSGGTSQSWTVTSSASFPAITGGTSQFHVADPAQPSELVLVTNVSGATWTVTRGAGSTTPVAHASGFTVFQVADAGTLGAFAQTGFGDLGGTGSAPSVVKVGGAVTSGQYARGNGSAVVLSAIQAADLPAGTGPQAWQFQPESYGAKGDARMLYDVSMNGTTAVLTTAGLPAPSSWPAGSQITGSGSGGNLAAGVYQVKTTYVNVFGETLPSTAASYTASGSVSSIVANSPAPWTNATAFNVYCTVAGGSTFFKQNTTPVALRSSYTITVVGTSGANPPAANTSNSAPFTANDVGKHILVPSAGGFVNVPLSTTIASYQSATQVTLANASSRAVTGEGAVYGTDDTAALQSCLNAAVSYAQTAGLEPDATVDVILTGTYAVAGAPGGTNMAAQLQLPDVDPYTGAKVNLRFVVPQAAPGPVHWEQPNPPMPRGTLVSLYYNDSAGGFGPPPAVVVGGPVTGYGGLGGRFSNMRVSGDLNFLVAYRSCVGGLDLYGVSQAAMGSVGYFCMAATTTAAGGWPQYISANSNPSAWQTFGYRTPTTGNNDQNELGAGTFYGCYHGVVFTDHFTAGSVKSLNTFFACTVGGSSNSHHCTIASLSSELTFAPLYWDNSGTYSGGANLAVFVGSLHSENASFIIDDPGNFAQGEVHAEQLSTTGQIAIGKNGGANLKLVWSNQVLGHVSSPPAVPATTVALTNTYYQAAAVAIHTGVGVTVSAITLDGTATGQTMAASSSLTVPVRNGGTIALTYAGGTPTWDWWLG